MEIIGWIGAILFALSAVPQAVASYRQGHSRGLSAGFLLLWLAGEVLTLAYVLVDVGAAPLILNYVVNLACLLVIVRYYLFPRGGK